MCIPGLASKELPEQCSRLFINQQQLDQRVALRGAVSKSTPYLNHAHEVYNTVADAND